MRAEYLGKDFHTEILTMYFEGAKDKYLEIHVVFNGQGESSTKFVVRIKNLRNVFTTFDRAVDFYNEN